MPGVSCEKQQLEAQEAPTCLLLYDHKKSSAAESKWKLERTMFSSWRIKHCHKHRLTEKGVALAVTRLQC